MQKIISLIELYMEEGNDADLHQALELIDQHKVKFNEIMEAIQDFKAEPQLKARAINTIRKHFGLSLIPGAVCQRQP